eukprot:gene11065-7872_t
MSFQQEYYGDSPKYQNITAVCQQPAEIALLTAALANGVAYSTSCGGYSWRTFVCNGNAVFCVNCKQNCVSTVSCPSASLIMNPCGTSCQIDAASGVTISLQYTPIALYPTLSVVSTASQQRQVIATVVLSKPGIVYCRAISSGSTIKTIRDVIDSGSQSVLWNTTTGNITVGGLIPESTYSLVCLTSDFQQRFMPLEDALSSRTSVSTSCCRRLTASYSTTTVPQYVSSSGRTEPVFQFTLDSVPVKETRLFLSVFTSSCNGTIAASTTSVTTVPSSFRFYPNSTDFSASFVVRGTATGCYTVVGATTGLSYQQASVTLSIVNVNLAPPVPKISRILFSDDLLKLLVVFNVATDQGASRFTSASFNCSAIVLYPGATGSVCSWINTTTLVASLSQIGSGSGPVPGDTVTLRPNIVKAACESSTSCGSYATVPRTSLSLSSADDPAIPSPVLVGPLSVSICSDITLNPMGSTGSGYRSWSSVAWYVDGTVSVANQSVVQSYLNANFASTSRVVTIPSQLLVVGTYRITLEVSNFAGLASVVTSVVRVTDTASGVTPSIVLLPSTTTAFRAQGLQISSRVSFPTKCGVGNDTGSVTYTWRAYENFTYVALQSTSSNPSVFRLAPFVLTPATNYTITLDIVTVVPFKGTFQGRSSVLFVTGVSGVVSAIKGGETRDVAVSRSLVVDASSSYDADYADDSSSALSYKWKCMVLSPSYGSTCADLASILASSTSSTWTVPANSLTQSRYQISVTVSNAFGRSMTTTQVWNVVNDAIPNVVLAAPAVFYNPNSAFSLVASVLAPTPNVSVTCTWSVSGATVSAIASSPVTRVISSGLSSFPLAIKPYKLVGGTQYTFTFDAKYSASAVSASSSMTITMNSPPFGGSLSVSPSEGNAMTTVFSLVAADWTDSASDYPLYYAFFYFVSANADVMVVQTKDLFPSAQTVLGQGLNSQRYLVTCLVSCVDNYGGSANVTSAATVSPPEDLGTVLLSIQASLNKTMGRTDSSATVTQLIQSSLPSINVVDCSVPTPCATLNRSACSTVSRTCGPCLAGSYGIDGPSNVACSSRPLGIGAACQSSRACATGSCRGGLCVDAQKSCPSDCSNAGLCRFVSERNETVESCGTLDTTCLAVCRCRGGRYGRDCSLSTGRLVQNLAIKRQFCLSLSATYGNQDVSFDVVQARAVAVSQLVVDPIQIADFGTFAACASVLLRTIEDDAELACDNSQGTFASVMNALNNLLYFLRTQSDAQAQSWYATDDFSRSAWEQNVTSTIVALSAGCQSSLAVGEAGRSMRTNEMRMLSVLDAGQFLSGSTVAAPMSSYETLASSSGASVEASSVSLYLGQEYAASTVGVTVFQNQYSAQSYDDAMVTTSTGNASAAGLNASSVVAWNMTLYNRADVVYKNFSTSFVTLNCDDILPQPYPVDHVCPGNFRFTVFCPAMRRGHINLTCPEVYQRPVCTVKVGTAFVDSQDGLLADLGGSRRLWVGDRETSAEVPVRRQLQASSTDVFEISTRFDTVFAPLESAFAESPAFLDVYSQYAVISVTACITGLFIAFAGVLFRYQSDEDRERKAHAKGGYDLHGLQSDASKKHKSTGGLRVGAKVAVVDSDEGFLDLDSSRKVEFINEPALLHVDESTPLYLSDVPPAVRTIRSFFNQMVPVALSKRPWFLRFWKDMLRDHSFFPNAWSTRIYYAAYVWCKFLLTVSITTVIVWLFYRDNEQRCPAVTEEGRCLRETVIGSYGQACQWEPSNLSCQFRPPSVTATLVLLLSAVVLTASTVAEFCLCRLFDGVGCLTLYQQDEFVRIVWDTPLRTKLRQGVRFYQQRATMELSLPKEEALFVLHTQQRYWDQALRDRAISDALNDMWYHRLWYRLSASSAESATAGSVRMQTVLAMIQEARARALLYRQQLGEDRPDEWKTVPYLYRHRSGHLVEPNHDDDEDLVTISETEHLAQQELFLWKLIGHEERHWQLANHDDPAQLVYGASDLETIEALYNLHQEMSRYHDQRLRERRLFRWFLLECFAHQSALSAKILGRCLWRRTDAKAMAALRVLDPYYVSCASARYAQTILHQQNDPHHHPHHNYLHAGSRSPAHHSLYAAAASEGLAAHNLPKMTLPEAQQHARQAFLQVQDTATMVVALLTVALSAGLFVLIYVLGSEIGSVSLGLWSVVFMVALVQNLFLLEALTIFIRGVAVPAYVRRPFHRLLHHLQRNAPVIFMRSTGGHLRTANSFVQHFNPAVRAARFYPQYPVSRLLMNLSDTDLPLRPIAPAPFTLQSPPQLLVPYVGHVVWTWARRVAEEGLLHVVHLPVALQDVTWRWYLIVLLQTAAWALSWLYEANVGALIFVTLLVFAALVGLPLGLLLRDVYAARRRRRQVNRHIFSTMDAASTMRGGHAAAMQPDRDSFAKGLGDAGSETLNHYQLAVDPPSEPTAQQASVLLDDEYDENNMIIGDDAHPSRSHMDASVDVDYIHYGYRFTDQAASHSVPSSPPKFQSLDALDELRPSVFPHKAPVLDPDEPAAGAVAGATRQQQQLFADPNPYRVPAPRPVSSTSSHLSTTAQPPSQRQMQRLQRSRTADRRAQPPPDSSGRGTGRVATQSYGSTWRQRQRQMQQPLAAGPGRDHAEQWADTHTSAATAATAPASAPPVSYFQQATVSQAQWLDEDPAGALAAHIINANLHVLGGSLDREAVGPDVALAATASQPGTPSRRALSAPPRSHVARGPNGQQGGARHGPGSLDDDIQRSLASQKRHFPMFIQ